MIIWNLVNVVEIIEIIGKLVNIVEIIVIIGFCVIICQQLPIFTDFDSQMEEIIIGKRS